MCLDVPWKILFHGFQIKRSEFKLSNCRKTPILYLLNGERERERERERQRERERERERCSIIRFKGSTGKHKL